MTLKQTTWRPCIHVFSEPSALDIEGGDEDQNNHYYGHHELQEYDCFFGVATTKIVHVLFH